MIGIVGLGNLGGYLFEALNSSVSVRCYAKATSACTFRNDSQQSIRHFADSILDLSSDCEIIIVAIRTSQLDDFLTTNADAFVGSKLIFLQAGNVGSLLENHSHSAKFQFGRVITNVNSRSKLAHSVVLRPDDEIFEREIVNLFSLLGSVKVVDDSEILSTFSVVTGCYPAVLARFTQQLVSAAEAIGIDKEEARIMVLEVSQNTFETLSGSGQGFDEYVNSVCSKGGVMERAMRELSEEILDEAKLENWVSDLTSSLIAKV